LKKRENFPIRKHANTILKLHKEGKNIPEIADILGCSDNGLYYFFNQNNIEPNRYKRSKYQHNKNFFNKINSHEKAWVLGWFYSDGSNQYPKCIKLALAEEDKHILEIMKELFKYTGPIPCYLDKRSKEPDKARWQKMCEFTINGKELGQQLINLGCMNRKTFKLKMPTKEWVPEKFLNSFILGVWEGDGSIKLRKMGNHYNSSIDITGTKDLIYNLKKYSCSILSLPFGSIEPHKTSKGIFTWRFSGNHQVKKFLEWAYKDCKYRLNRKYQKYQIICDNYNYRNEKIVWLRKNEDVIIDLYQNEDISARCIANNYNISAQSIIKTLKRCGIQIRCGFLIGDANKKIETKGDLPWLKS